MTPEEESKQQETLERGCRLLLDARAAREAEANLLAIEPGERRHPREEHGQSL